jgi:hypothetical protein
MAMDREAVLSKVRRKITSLPGIIRMEFLDQEFRDILYGLEKEAEVNGACGGLMPFTNDGVWAAFEREVQFVIVAEESAILIGESSGLVFISDQKGQIVGEWVNPKRAEELEGRADVFFLGKDFVMYPGVEIVGEPFFVLPPVDFPYLDDMPEVTDVASGSISTLADDYIRARWGYSESKHWTHLIGFNIRKDEKK